ncbi:unnamed protein product [Brassicogethes aeneus]|uniref:Alpha N-terminal protein methyltransferase 1 n=1 Tax=Brassicogethes aeneus TaxID=1431903 RepID=A0A9P0B7I9_BRAAE|nr:unnamed protein product [Brassicogethes aeneus]
MCKMTDKLIKKSVDEFYTDGAHYWAEVPATVDGMLGGFGHISQVDIRGSKTFIKQLLTSKSPPGRDYALDCGAGIGRITKFLLTNVFNKVDLVEQNPLFLDQAKKYLGTQLDLKIGKYYAVGLQNFDPEPCKYDVIWIQWVLGHLTDEDFIKFFQKCQKGLKDNGYFIVKENITSNNEIEMDEQDSSVTRPMLLLKELFKKANLEVFRQEKQTNFPKGIYSVYMFALRPKKSQEIDDLSDTKVLETELKNNVGT